MIKGPKIVAQIIPNRDHPSDSSHFPNEKSIKKPGMSCVMHADWSLREKYKLDTMKGAMKTEI